MRICFIPIDNRPVCYSLAKDISAIDKDIELLIPPREYMGGLVKKADINKLFKWLNDVGKCDIIIISLDTMAYGGLISSRRGTETFGEIKAGIEKLKQILSSKNAKIYAFSSIMRISNNNFNEEEKEYWKDYGKKIFEYSYNFHKYGQADSSTIPDEILADYLDTRKRNFEINKIYLEWEKEGFFETLVFSKDDCAEYGLNVKEAKELESMGSFVKTGADEIPLTLLARSIRKEIKVFVEYTEPDCKALISNYEDVSVEKSVLGQLELGGFTLADKKDNADIILIVNNFRGKQGELVMGWDTPKLTGQIQFPTDKPFAVADVRYANGADNNFIEQLLPAINRKFMGYAGWNTSANTLGSLLAAVKIKFEAQKYDENAFNKLQIIRFLDDWAYQANVRLMITEPCDVCEQMYPFAKRILNIFDCGIETESLNYTYPWNRKFEIEVNVSK